MLLRLSYLLFCFCLAALLFRATTTEATGTLKGVIRHDGPAPKLKKRFLSKEKCGGCPHGEFPDDSLIVDPQTGGIQWAIVRVMGVKPRIEIPPGRVEISQADCKYTPRVSILSPASDVWLHNPDRLPHNSHLIPLDGINRPFGRMLVAHESPLVLRGAKMFAEPEIIQIQCDIHPWMKGFLVVHDPRYATITAEDGKFEITHLPVGKYKVVINHDLGEQEREFEIKSGETTDLGDILFRHPGSTGRAAGTGSLKGIFKFDGPVPKPKFHSISKEKAGGCPHEDMPDESLVVDPQTRGMKWGIVRVMDVQTLSDPEPTTVEITQAGCKFTPRVSVVAPGSDIDVLNPDKLPHNVHTIPLDGINIPINRMMTANDAKLTVKGKKHNAEPELVQLQCDIHPWMKGYIVVHDPRFATVTAEDGKFVIENIPPGKYKVLFNHDLGEQEKEFEIKKDETTDAGEILFKVK